MEVPILDTTLRIFCRKIVVPKTEDPQLWWLIGSPFFPSPTIISIFKSIHTLPSNHSSPDFDKESDDIKLILPKGFEVVGALIAKSDSDAKSIASEAINAATRLRKLLHHDSGGDLFSDQELVGAAVSINIEGGIHYFLSRSRSPETLVSVSSVIHEDQSEKFIWQRGCLLRCQLPIRLPVYYPGNQMKELENAYLHAVDAVAQKFMDPLVTYVLEGQNGVSGGRQHTTVSGSDLNRHSEYLDKTDGESGGDCLSCSYMCSKADAMTAFISLEKNADVIAVSIFSNHSRSTPKPTTPVVEYYPAVDDVKMLVVEHDLDVVCYADKDMPLASAISKLLVPALVDQLHSMRKKMLGSLLRHHSQLRPYHFIPPGFLHPITVMYDLHYGETEIEQEEVRRSVHLRIGLPMDRPLLRVANALHLTVNESTRRNPVERGGLLKDVHIGIPSSGVSGGRVSLVQGSYEYYHYLLDGFDDSGWGCAYRSLQTIISWFRLQHYTGVGVPSHREIQQTLVEMGDKDPPFIGSREWIGAIELSFVLDKLLGVSCKVINVRSGADLPEKCRELALHFETQGTPIMIGGGVLAYTLLGVDYNEVSGDCAFLILDPHYTGNDDLKKIVNGGWCGWKKAVDSKGKHFFLHDKFYNLLLPQRPFMV